jgi:hypothetical protein
LSDLAVISPHLSDSAALDAAVAIVLRHPERRREFQDLVRERGWDAAAMVAAYDCQARSMRLRWWELPPCVAGTRGKDRAARLRRRMARRNISRYHPNPLPRSPRLARRCDKLNKKSPHALAGAKAIDRLEERVRAPVGPKEKPQPL